MKKFELARNLIRAKNRLFHNARKLIRVKKKIPRARKLIRAKISTNKVVLDSRKSLNLKI